jgi:hypothetical protein
MNNKDTKGTGPLWIIWIMVLLIVPWIPLSQVVRGGEHVIAQRCWLAYGIVLSVSLLLAGCRARSRAWTREWIGESLSTGIGLSILGAVISSVIGFAGCTAVVFSRL